MNLSESARATTTATAMTRDATTPLTPASETAHFKATRDPTTNHVPTEIHECLEKAAQVLDALRLHARTIPPSSSIHVGNALTLADRIHKMHQSLAAQSQHQQSSHLAPLQDRGYELKRMRLNSRSSPSVSPDRDANRKPKRPRGCAALDPTAQTGSDWTLMDATTDRAPSPTDLILSLPILQANVRIVPRCSLLGVPSDIRNAYFSRPKLPYAPRYLPDTGHLVVYGYQQRMQVLSHHLIAPRSLNDMIQSAYLSHLHNTCFYRSKVPVLIEPLLRRGFGSVMAHQDLAALVSTSYIKGNPSRAIAQAATRPYMLVQVADRSIRPDLWNMLMAIRDDMNSPVPPAAKLGLLAGIEIDGFEEPSSDSRLPPEPKRAYKLCERIAILVSVPSIQEHPDTSMKTVCQSNMVPKNELSDSDADDLSSLDEWSSGTEGFQVDSCQSRARAPQGPPSNPSIDVSLPQHAIPSSLLNQLSKGFALSLSPIMRYANASSSHPGQLLVSNLPCSAHVVSHTLAPVRVLPRATVNKYLGHVAATYSQPGLLRDMNVFAVQRGPTRPFTLQVAQEQAGSSPKSLWEARRTVARCVLRPVLLVGRLDSTSGEYRAIRQQLISQADNAQDDRRLEDTQLGMLVGLEVVGFEQPRAADRVPPLDECQFVLRERYALIAGDMSTWDSIGGE